MAKKYGDRVHFLCVYIKEAHPTDGWQVADNVRDGILYAEPATIEERADVAAACMLRFNFSFPMVLDDMTNETESAYIAMPERLYVLDGAGRVTWKCGLGPYYFDPDAFEIAIADLIPAW